jgi:hypothetical protein
MRTTLAIMFAALALSAPAANHAHAKITAKNIVDWYGTVTCSGAAFCACPDDGRLKGVQIGSPLFRTMMGTMQGHKCIVTGPNGVFLLTTNGMTNITPR